MRLRLLTFLGFLACPGCCFLPDMAYQPSLHNPYPQLSKVAIAPFFNLSAEPTVDSRKFALAYFSELQQVPGYEVVAVGTVEQMIRQTSNRLTCPEDARKLAQDLGVDAVVIGAVTDYSPYYPPRCALQVEWYSANPGFHPIPPGYGLPWGKREEQEIPGQLIFEAEMALAKAQLATQTPNCPPPARTEPTKDDKNGGARKDGATDKVAAAPPGPPAEWPDPRGFVPPPPSPRPPTCWPSNAPVMRHTRTYSGNDAAFTEALSNYYFFQDDARFGGWQNYLTRSDDFIRFCCHMHIWEMLSARGGAGESRVVWRWQVIR